MSKTKHITGHMCEQILAKVVRKQLAVVLTQRIDNKWHTFHAHLRPSPHTPNILLASLPAEGKESRADQPRPGTTTGVVFRLGHKKGMFCTEVCDVRFQNREWQLVLVPPHSLQLLQRRAFERAEPPVGTVISVRFWLEDAGLLTDRCDMRHGQLENLSAGGMQISVGEAADSRIGDAYHCAFTPRSGTASLIMESILRHRDTVGRGRVSFGFQFIGLETTDEGQRTLDRLAQIVRFYQRSRFRKSGEMMSAKLRPAQPR